MIKNFTENETSAFSKIILGEKTGAIKVFYRTGQIYLITSTRKNFALIDLFNDFINAQSKGKFFGQQIKNNPELIVERV